MIGPTEGEKLTVLTDPWHGLRPVGLTTGQVASSGIALDDDYRARMLPLVDALENGSPVPTYWPARHSLVARLPRSWTGPRAEHLVQLTHDSGLEPLVGRGYVVVRLPGPDAERLAQLREALGDRAARPLMGGVLHLRRDVAPGSAQAAALAHLLEVADRLLRDELELADFAWSTTRDDLVLTAHQRPATTTGRLPGRRAPSGLPYGPPGAPR